METEKAIGLLMDIKSDVGSLRGDVGELRGELRSRPCFLHQAELTALGTKIDAVDLRVDAVDAKVAKLGWGRALLVAALVGILGLVGAVAGDVIKDILKGGTAKAAEVQPLIVPQDITDPTGN